MRIEYIVRVYQSFEDDYKFETFVSSEEALEFADYFEKKGCYVQVVKRTEETVNRSKDSSPLKVLYGDVNVLVND